MKKNEKKRMQQEKGVKMRFSSRPGVEHAPAAHLGDAHVDPQEGVVLRRVVGEEEPHLWGGGGQEEVRGG